MKFDFKLQPGRTRSHGNYVCNESAKPLVTIVTAYYNAGKYFEQTFNSVMNQTFPWFEWIIVNDGSNNEEDITILEKYSKLDNRIKIINQLNGGLSCARNTGFSHAVTELVIPLDADDLISAQYIEYLYWALYYNKDAAWAYTNCLGFQDQEYMWKKTFDAERMKKENLLVATAMIRKSAYEEVGGYKVEKWSYNEDWRFWLELLEKHKHPVHVQGYLFWYRRLGNGMLSTIKKNPEQEEFAKRIIEKAAENVDVTVKAVEYPMGKTCYPYYESQEISLGNDYIVDNNNTHILMVIPWLSLGGADKFNLDFTKNLDKEKFEISIMTTVIHENDWQQKFECYTDKIFNLPDFLDPANYMDFISYYIKAKSVDVLMVTNSYNGYYMLPWLRKKFPHLCIIDYVHMEEWYWKAGGFARISGMMGGFLDKTYVCNSVTREVIVEKFGRDADSVKTMYIGVDAEEFCRDKVASGYLYKNYDITSDKKIILFPCRIHPQKRPFMMLDIAQKVYEENNSAVFVVVGDGEQLEDLKKAIQQRKLNDVVLCIGRTDKMKECYHDARLTLICSLKEGLALTAYESCSMGVPVISSDVGGQRDLIDSTVGRLVQTKQIEETALDSRDYDRQEIDEFAEAILQFLEDDDLYTECSKNCRNKIEKTFSIEIMSKNMENEILSLVSSEQLARQHMEMAESLKKQGKFAEEFYTSYILSEAKQAECDEVWQARCYFKEMAEGKFRTRLIDKVYQLWSKLIHR